MAVRRFRRRNNKKTKRTRKPRAKRSATGQFKINRMMTAFGITKGITAGLITSGNTSVLNFGTPVLSVNGITSFYDVPFSLQFSLDQLQGYTDITNISDRYKLLSASITIHGGNTAAAVGSNMPWIEYIVDHDDASVPTIASIREKMGVRNKGFNQQGILRLSVPSLRVAQSVYNTSLTSGYAVPGKATFINSLYPAVPHYGMKGVLRAVYLDGSNNSNQFIVDVRLSAVCADLQ